MRKALDPCPVSGDKVGKECAAFVAAGRECDVLVAMVSQDWEPKVVLVVWAGQMLPVACEDPADRMVVLECVDRGDPVSVETVALEAVLSVSAVAAWAVACPVVVSALGSS
jgi:hypothetical protein